VITAKSVNKANEEIDGLTDEQLDQAIDRLFGDQPEVLGFLEGYGLGDGEIQELAILLTYFVFKASEAENPGKAATVKREDFESVFDEATAWMAELERPEAIDYPPPESEPFLFGYIIKNLNEHLTTPREDGTPYTGYDQRVILMAIKMVVLALERAARRRSAEDSS
jgi:hypothetical protein